MIKTCDDIRKSNYLKFIIDNGFTCFKPDEVFTNCPIFKSFECQDIYLYIGSFI